MKLDEAKKLVSENDPEALYTLGRAYLDGKDLEPNLELAYEYLKKAADLNYSDAAEDLGLFLYSGYKFKRDGVKAFPFLIKASELGSGKDVEEAISDCYRYGEVVKANKFQEFKWHIRSLETDDLDYQDELRLTYRSGAYIKQIKEESFQKIDKEAKSGKVDYLFYLGCYFYERLRYEEAFPNFLEAATKGHKVSQYNLATLYCEGRGTKVNHDEAQKWYKKAADKKFAPAYLMLAAYRFKNITEGIDEESSYVDVVRDFNKSYELGQENPVEELSSYFDYNFMDE